MNQFLDLVPGLDIDVVAGPDCITAKQRAALVAAREATTAAHLEADRFNVHQASADWNSWKASFAATGDADALKKIQQARTLKNLTGEYGEMAQLLRARAAQVRAQANLRIKPIVEQVIRAAEKRRDEIEIAERDFHSTFNVEWQQSLLLKRLAKTIENARERLAKIEEIDLRGFLQSLSFAEGEKFQRLNPPPADEGKFRVPVEPDPLTDRQVRDLSTTLDPYGIKD